jgi:hypothetical protein
MSVFMTVVKVQGIQNIICIICIICIAIWLKPRYNDYGLWPASGEIDVVETRANKKLTNAAGVSQGIDTMGATLHFGLNSSYNIWRPTHWEK